MLSRSAVVVMVTDQETKVAKPVAYLYKGMTFGVSSILTLGLAQN